MFNEFYCVCGTESVLSTIPEQIACDKQSLSDLIQSLGIAVPPTYNIIQHEDYVLMSIVQYKFFVKLRSLLCVFYWTLVLLNV